MSSSSPWIEPGDGANAEANADVVQPLNRDGLAAAPSADGGEPRSGRFEGVGVEVVVRLIGGDSAVLGRFAEVEEAKAAAGDLAHSLGRGDAGEWPLVAGRFLRPGAVISIDVMETGPPKWVGSSDRSAAWTGRRD